MGSDGKNSVVDLGLVGWAIGEGIGGCWKGVLVGEGMRGRGEAYLSAVGF